MRDLVLLAIHLLVTLAKFLRPVGVRTVAAESLSLKHQALIGKRSRQRAPNLTTRDRRLSRNSPCTDSHGEPIQRMIIEWFAGAGGVASSRQIIADARRRSDTDRSFIIAKEK